MDFVSWDDDIPNIWKTKKMFQTTNLTAIELMTLGALNPLSMAIS